MTERPDGKQSRKAEWPWVLGLWLLLAALHSPVLRGRVTYFHDDLWAWFLPVHDWLRRELWEGNRLPWCPLVSCGYPLAAEPQTGIWYPLNLVLALPLPIGQAMGLLLWLHYGIAASGMYVLARRIGAGRLGSFCAGMVFACSGFMIAHLHHVAILTAAAWFPWVWYGLLAYRYDEKRRRWLVALVGWCSAAQLLAGQPQVWPLSFGSGLIMLGLAEVLLEQKGVAGREARRRWSVLVLAAGLGAGVAAVTILPMMSLYALTARARSSWDFVTSYCLSKESLQTLLGLRLNVGDAWEYEAFAGLSTLALAFVAIRMSKRRGLVYLLAAMILIALFMGLAQVNPLYRVVVHVPLLSGFRCAARWLLIVSACLGLLAAVGVTALSKWRWAKVAAAAVVVAEVMWFGWHYNPVVEAEALEPVKVAAASGRVVSATPFSLPEGLSHRQELALGRELLVPNVNMMAEVAAVDGYMPLQLAHFVRLKQRAQWVRNPGDAAGCGVGTLITLKSDHEPPEHWRPVEEVGATRRYENMVAPRLAWLEAGGATAEEWRGSPAVSLGEAEVVREDGRGVSVRCKAAEAGRVVLAYTWLPWWEATVNGQPVEVQRTQVAFCSVRVPAGESLVELRYRQPRLGQGLVVSLVCLVLLGVVALRGGNSQDLKDRGKD